MLYLSCMDTSQVNCQLKGVSSFFQFIPFKRTENQLGVIRYYPPLKVPYFHFICILITVRLMQSQDVYKRQMLNQPIFFSGRIGCYPPPLFFYAIAIMALVSYTYDLLKTKIYTFQVESDTAYNISSQRPPFHLHRYIHSRICLLYTSRCV